MRFLFALILSLPAWAQIPTVTQQYMGTRNYLVNPGFEQGAKGWEAGTTLSRTTVNGSIDGLAGCVTLDGEELNISQSVTTNMANLKGQGFASAWVYVTFPGAELCSVIDGVDQRCSTIEKLSTWDNFTEIPFIFGATSYGLRLKTDDPVTGTACLDNTYAGLPPAGSLYETGAVGPEIPYTPTFTGFGAVTVSSFKYRIVGSKIEIEGKFTSGTTTAVEARVSLPENFVSSVASIRKVGQGARSVGTTDNFHLLSETGLGYLTIAREGPAGGLTKVNASSFLSAGEEFSFLASVPIAGLNSRVSLYSQQCKKPSDCENVFSAKIANNGTTASITSQSTPWLTLATRNSQGVVTLDFVPGIFTVTPSCVAIPVNSAGVSKAMQFDSVSSTSAVTRIRETSAGGLLDLPHEVICQKQAPDYKERNMITGSFEGVATTTEFSGSSAITITATGTAPTKGVTAKDSIRWHREGKWMVIYLDYQQTASTGAANGTGKYLILVPDGKTIDSSIVSFNTSASGIAALTPGTLQGNCSGAFGGANGLVGFPAAHSSTQFYITGYFGGTPNAWGPAGVGGFASTAAVNINCAVRIPITEWGVN
jgi:hypothetical protein